MKRYLWVLFWGFWLALGAFSQKVLMKSVAAGMTDTSVTFWFGAIWLFTLNFFTKPVLIMTYLWGFMQQPVTWQSLSWAIREQMRFWGALILTSIFGLILGGFIFYFWHYWFLWVVFRDPGYSQGRYSSWQRARIWWQARPFATVLGVLVFDWFAGLIPDLIVGSGVEDLSSFVTYALLGGLSAWAYLTWAFRMSEGIQKRLSVA